MIKVGIVGASGYTGAELLRLCAAHPQVEVVVATADTHAGTLAASLYPSLTAAYPNLVFGDMNVDMLAGLDAVFLALPHEASHDLVPALVGRVGCVVDLSAAYRLKDPNLYPVWYGFEHGHAELLGSAVYGLPELYRTEISGAGLVATPGCYVTAASLALAPLVRGGFIDDQGVIVDAASGVSGAGRGLKHSSLFATVDEDFTAYGLLDHRHTPEMEQVTGAQILFTPHLAPMSRGILATCYAKPKGLKPTTASLLAALATFYKDEPFIVVRPQIPSTKATLGSNSVHLTARYDERTDTVVVLASLDNIAKGASGGAMQAMNVALGIDETAGLSTVGVYP